MAHSVHELAMEGILGMRLASCKVNLTVDGREHRGALYVTRCTVTKVRVEGGRAAGDQGDGCFPTAQEFLNLRGTASLSGLQVLAHLDGSAELSDDEWEVARTILAPTIRKATATVDHRCVIDGLLLKLKGDVRTWRELSAPGVSQPLFLYYYQKMHSNRTLHIIVRRVNEMRLTELSRGQNAMLAPGLNLSDRL